MPEYKIPVNLTDKDIADLKTRRGNPVSDAWRTMRITLDQIKRQNYPDGPEKDRQEVEGLFAIMEKAGVRVRVEEAPDLQAEEHPEDAYERDSRERAAKWMDSRPKPSDDEL